MESSPALKMEFAVQMTCSGCEENVRRALRGVKGVRSTQVDWQNDLVLVESNLLVDHVQKLLEATGKLVLFRGSGSTVSGVDSPAAVAIFSTDQLKGLVWFLQVDERSVVVDGTVDGLEPGEYCLKVRQFGDLSQGSASCGEVLSISQSESPEGVLGALLVNHTGRAQFRITSCKLRVLDVIGRSLSIDTDRGCVACSVIARSSGIFQNTKRFCTCDGVSLWDEAEKAKK